VLFNLKHKLSEKWVQKYFHSEWLWLHMFCTVCASIQIISRCSLIHYTRLISEEHFDDGPPFAIVLPIAEENATNWEVAYLIEEIHTTGRWPILVYVSSNMNGHMYSDTNKHGAYIILILGPCEDWQAYISRFQQQVYEMSVSNLMQH
jgi:hypothetical protein